MKEEINKKLFYVGIILSTFIGSIMAFGLYLEKYLRYHTEIRQQILNGLKMAGVLENRYGVFLSIILLIGMFLFWTVCFIVYKVIFLCARVKVKDIRLLIGLGAGLTLSYLVSYVLVGNVPVVVVTLLSNLAEIVVIFAGLFDDIKGRMKMCVMVRGAILVVSLWSSVYMI